MAEDKTLFTPNPKIRDAFIVEYLNHNLLSISLLRDKGNNITFNSSLKRVKF